MKIWLFGLLVLALVSASLSQQDGQHGSTYATAQAAMIMEGTDAAVATETGWPAIAIMMTEVSEGTDAAATAETGSHTTAEAGTEGGDGEGKGGANEEWGPEGDGEGDNGNGAASAVVVSLFLLSAAVGVHYVKK